MPKLIFAFALMLFAWSCTKEQPNFSSQSESSQMPALDRGCGTPGVTAMCAARIRVNWINGVTNNFGALLRVAPSLGSQQSYFDWFRGCDTEPPYWGNLETVGTWYSLPIPPCTNFVVALREVNHFPGDCDVHTGSLNYTIESNGVSDTRTMNFTVGFPGPTFGITYYGLGSDCVLALPD